MLGANIQLDHINHCFAGSVVYPPGGAFGPRIQKDVQLVMVYSGIMEISIDGVFHKVQPGHAALLLPGHEETFTFSRDQDTWHRWIATRLEPLDADTMDSLRKLPFSMPLTEGMNRITDLMLLLMPSYPEDSPVLRSLALAALHMYPQGLSTSQHQGEKHPAIHIVRHWIGQHYGEEVTLGQLASQAGVTSEHLIRLFRKFEHRTPMQYLWQFRMERAKELLIHTGLAVTEISERCGFKTSHHFAAMMKRQTGQTPTQLRSNHWAIHNS